MDSTHKWNVEKTDEGIRVCFGDHHRSEGCDFVDYVPASSVDTARAEALREAAENEQKEKAIAFVKGAKWWEYHSTKSTMWQSDQELAAIEAEKRFGYKPTLDDLFPKETMARIISILADKQEGNNV